MLKKIFSKKKINKKIISYFQKDKFLSFMVLTLPRGGYFGFYFPI